MFFAFESILCLVTLFTSTVFSLPVGSSSLVARQDGNPQRQLFCHYNVVYCRENFGWYCKEANPPEWCSRTFEEPPSFADLPIDSTSLVARQDGNPQRQTFCHYNVNHCRNNFGWYCKEANPPEWCSQTFEEPPSPAELSIDSTSLVARQDDNLPPESVHEMFCELNAEFCQTEYPEECKGGRDEFPAWCHITPSTELPGRLPPRLYCKYNVEFCRRAFPEDCNAGNEMIPEWCHVESPPTEDPDADKPSQEEVREMFCRYNALYCRENFAEDCKAGNEMIPEWCHVRQPPVGPPTEDPDDNTTLVARQDDNPARQLFCEKNAEYCQEHYPGYCKPGNDKVPSWCHIKSPPTSVSVSGPALIASQDSIDTALSKRTPQDPDREEEEREEEEREMEEEEMQHEQEQEHEHEQHQEEEEEEEEEEKEEPHLYDRSWCKKHPHHPACYSQFCIDNPGRCKMITGNEPPQSISKRDKKGGWYCFWLC